MKSLEKKEIERLAKFLLKYYPHEFGRGDPINGESAVDMAIRILMPTIPPKEKR